MKKFAIGSTVVLVLVVVALTVDATLFQQFPRVPRAVFGYGSAAVGAVLAQLVYVRIMRMF
jgi:hypothetical protein